MTWKGLHFQQIFGWTIPLKLASQIDQPMHDNSFSMLIFRMLDIPFKVAVRYDALNTLDELYVCAVANQKPQETWWYNQ